jgi:transcriptional regulator with GAF, ATPase, and Fis domain
MDLVLEVWREVCRHLDIHESVDRLMPALARALPLGTLMIRRVDLGLPALETVACASASDSPRKSRKESLSAADVSRLIEWSVRRQVTVASDEGPGPIREIVAPGLAGDLLIGPLVSEEGAWVGVLLLAALPAKRFAAEAKALAERLLEPFAAALENDSRLREIRAMREALEADKQALLTRLDRTDITESVVGADTGLRTVMDRVEQVARSDAPVLVLGETGSGKEVIARAIHSRSRRSAGPVLRVNCGAIPPELIDSELFGHERGSFTGASASRRGWFERADGGTLFLDEIGELPPAAQVRMLRILQDGSFERVGGEKSLTVDVRIVAATHADLHAMVATGRFRQDLWYRISVFPIHLPPLRDRQPDIPAFAAHFAARAGKRLGGHPLVPTATDIALLQAYPWPGNVRELAAVIERAAILGNGRKLEIALALGLTPPRVSPKAPVSSPHLDSAGEPAPLCLAAPATLVETTRRAIEAALIETHGRIEGPFGAARRLGINPHTLRSRMRGLNIDWKRFRGKGIAS